MKRLIFALTAGLALSGCKVGIHTDVYTADVMEVLGGKEDMTTPMTFSFEVAGPDGCTKASNGLLAPLEAAYSEVEFTGCNRRGFNMFADFRVPAEIVNEIINGESESDQPIYIGARRPEDRNDIEVAYWVNVDALQVLRSAIPTEMTQFQPQTPDLFISATLANDLRNEIAVTVSDAFADGAPLQGTRTFNLARRNEVRIDLSNVTNAALATGEIWALIGYILEPSEQ